jgi:hypothetical protein
VCDGSPEGAPPAYALQNEASHHLDICAYRVIAEIIAQSDPRPDLRQAAIRELLPHFLNPGAKMRLGSFRHRSPRFQQLHASYTIQHSSCRMLEKGVLAHTPIRPIFPLYSLLPWLAGKTAQPSFYRSPHHGRPLLKPPTANARLARTGLPGLLLAPFTADFRGVFCLGRAVFAQTLLRR